MSFCPDSAKWFLARDLFLGINYKKKNFAEALKLASECKHKDAQWLCRCFPYSPPSTRHMARNIFIQHIETSDQQGISPDSRALTFAALLSKPKYNLILLNRAITQQIPYPAAAGLSSVLITVNDNYITHLVSAATENDPHSLCVLSNLYSFGFRVKQDNEMATTLLKRSFEYGSLHAYYLYAVSLKRDSPERYIYIFKALNTDVTDWNNLNILHCFLSDLFSNVYYQKHIKRDENLNTLKYLFLTGELLLKLDLTTKKEEYLKSSIFYKDIACLKIWENAYKECHKKALSAVVIWSLFAKKYLSNLVNHNIRRMISEYVLKDEWMWMNDISGKLTTP